MSSLILFTHKAPLFSVLVREPLSKIVCLNVNTAVYLILLEPYSFLPLVVNIYGGSCLHYSLLASRF